VIHEQLHRSIRDADALGAASLGHALEEEIDQQGDVGDVGGSGGTWILHDVEAEKGRGSGDQPLPSL